MNACSTPRVLFDFVVDTCSTLVAPAFPTPALRKRREERGTHCVGDANEIKSLGLESPESPTSRVIAVIGKAQNLPLINTDDTDQKRSP